MDQSSAINRRRTGSMPVVKTTDEMKQESPGRRRNNPGYETIGSVHGNNLPHHLQHLSDETSDSPTLVPRKKQERSITDSETMLTYTIRKSKLDENLG